jgi:hypothetical protein
MDFMVTFLIFLLIVSFVCVANCLSTHQSQRRARNQSPETHVIEIEINHVVPSSQTPASLGSNRSIPMAVMASLRNLGAREQQNIPVALPASIRGRRESQEPSPRTVSPIITDDVETQVVVV